MPAIWFKPVFSLDELQSLGKNTLGEHLGIQFTDIGEDFLSASMPVDHRTHQPAGLLHGGASCVLAETLGSVASYMVIDTAVFRPVGLEINANHVRGIRSGLVIGTSTAVHIGKTTHVWDIRIRDEKGGLICISRLTVAIIKA
jgi:1,4-dihydroxy-2-naphthoyl-CoA hydrolase